MFVGRHEIWPADWGALGLAGMACALFWIARRLGPVFNSRTLVPMTTTDLELGRTPR